MPSTADDANGQSTQVAGYKRFVLFNEMLIRNLPTGVRIPAAGTRINNELAKIFVIWIPAR